MQTIADAADVLGGEVTGCGDALVGRIMSRSTPYLMLMQAFVEGRLSGEEFSTIIQHMFSGERPGLRKSEFDIINDVTLSSDSYVEDEDLRRSSDWDEPQLREYVADSLQRLRSQLDTDVDL